MPGVDLSLERIRQLASDGERLGLSALARQRLGWLLHYCDTGRSVTRTCRHFGIPRMTLYRVFRRFSPDDPRTLEDRPLLPRHPPLPAPRSPVQPVGTAFRSVAVRTVLLGSVLANAAIAAAIIATALRESFTPPVRPEPQAAAGGTYWELDRVGALSVRAE